MSPLPKWTRHYWDHYFERNEAFADIANWPIPLGATVANCFALLSRHVLIMAVSA